MEKENDKTRKYNIKTAEIQNKDNKKAETKRVKKQSNKKSKKKHPKLRKFIKVFIIICILLFLVAIGIFAAIFFGDTWNMTEEDLVIKMQNSTTYDKNGKILHEMRGEENRKVIPLSEMGEYIPKAYVAIEDERFYDHSGIDLYRTAGAIFTYVINGGNSSFGGSTITQQLVKNLKKDDDDSISRKIREWSRAYKVEKMLSKSQILELYLNEIFVGGSNIHGVESGAKYYFNKSAKKLSLAESAFLAGINHSPNSYNPFWDLDNEELIKTRTKIVLAKMLEIKDENGNTYINQEQYDQAVAEVEKGLKFKEGKFAGDSDLSFLEAESINQVIEDMMEEFDLKREAAENRVYNNGYRIYTTEDPEIQERMEEEYLKEEYIKDATTEKGIKENAHSQSGMVIIDHLTGQVVGCMGGLGEDSPTYGLNRATSEMQAGSTMKPLAAIAPALENKVITAATVYDDSKTEFGGGYDPGNSDTYRGLITVRKAIEVSSNVVNVKIITDLGTSKSVDFLNELGMPQFTYKDDSMPSLALGGSTHGASPLQMAAGYAMIANKGEYIEPTFYTKVEDVNGKVIMEAKQEKKRMMTESNAYILTSILTAPVIGSEGTAGACAISGMDVAAKTGTTDDLKDRWLCGFTPYYTAATWFGYDEPEPIYGFYPSNPARTIWAAIMDDIHVDLEGKRFEEPDNIVTAKICLDSGKVATEECTHTDTEEFVSGTVPGKCDGHKKVKICKTTGKLATEYCPETEEKAYLSTPEKEINASWKTNIGNKYKEITETCDKHTEKNMTIKVENVIGMSESEAKKKLSGLKIQVIYESDSSKENGVVLKQSINAGTTLKIGDTITITVNSITEPEEPEEPEIPEEPDEPNTNNTITDTNEIADTNIIG